MNFSKKEFQNNQKHPFHLVDCSPWPLIASLAALGMTFGGVMFMHNYSNGFFLLILGLFTTL